MCRLGLLIETREGYEFFHNRIHQKAFEQIAPDRREAIHYRIAEVLLREQEQAETEEKWLSVGGHLLRCARLIKDAGDGSGLTVPLYRAGMTAKQSAAVEYALQLFRLAEELLDVTAWQEEDDHTLRVKLELAECLFICGRYDEAENCFLEMLAHVAEERDLAAVKKRYKLLHSYAGNAKRVIDLGLQALNHLGFHLVPRRFKFQLAKEILHGWYLFRNSRLEALQHAPFLGDERLAGILEILTVMDASASMVDEQLFLLIVLKTGNLSAQYGNSPYASLGYLAHSILWSNVFGDYRKGEKIATIGLEPCGAI